MSKTFNSKEIEDTQQELKKRLEQLQKEPKPINQRPLKAQINTLSRRKIHKIYPHIRNYEYVSVFTDLANVDKLY